MTMDTTREEMTQAVLEGVVFGLRDSFEVAKKLGIQIERTKICGGGAKSPLWRQMVADILKEKMDLREKENFIATRKGVLNPNTLSKEERIRLIKEKPEYGNIICRCEMITEGEIIDAIRRPLGAKSLDGVKRRTRAGMGRCQAGFCSPRTMEILARECHKSMFEITKSGGNSQIVKGINKDSL